LAPEDRRRHYEDLPKTVAGLRGAGGGRAGSGAAQGNLFTEVEHPEKE